MEQLIELTKADSSKYKDVINIFLKLQGEGGLNKLSAQLDKIFKTEIKFTIQELERIEKTRDEKLDIEKQCENNLDLFKTNFQVIVQLLVENAYKTATKEIPELANRKVMNTTKESEEQTEFQTSTSRISNSRLLEDTPKSKGTKTSISSKAKTTGKKKNKENSKKALRGETSPNSSSKMSSALNRIINSGSGSMSVTSARSGSKSNVGGFSMEASKIQNNSHISNLSKRSSMFYGSPNSRSNLSRSIVESEFNHIKGSATFENSKRSFLDFKETGPGPADYNSARLSPSNSKIRRSFSPTIGKAKKESYIQQLANTPSPGPGGLYPSHHFLSK